MYHLSASGKMKLSEIVNTILHCHTSLNEAAEKSQWRLYNKTQRNLYKALINLEDNFGVETVESKKAKRFLNESNS